MPDANYFEVRCERCQTSFAPGTKQCIHCGGALGRRLLAFDTVKGLRAELPRSDEHAVGGPDATPTLSRVFRIAMIALVVVSAIARACLGND